jgi:ferredoxin
LTEILDGRGHRFLAEVGTEAGAQALAASGCAPAGEEDLRTASEIMDRSADEMGRVLDTVGIVDRLARSRLSPRWEAIASRCLSCASCTLVCPTCYCTTVFDTQGITGEQATRWRRWDSCFAMRHSYIHGGPVRPSTAARYRQWLTHKFSAWQEQFGMPGCVGCGRCITWCPARIDVTVELEAIRREEIRAAGEAA